MFLFFSGDLLDDAKLEHYCDTVIIGHFIDCSMYSYVISCILTFSVPVFNLFSRFIGQISVRYKYVICVLFCLLLLLRVFVFLFCLSLEEILIFCCL